MTYRKDFLPLLIDIVEPKYNLTTDAGWGCMLRAG